jgi:hypothetical protein
MHSADKGLKSDPGLFRMMNKDCRDTLARSVPNVVLRVSRRERLPIE